MAEDFDPGRALGLPYGNHSRQRIGQLAERRQAKAYGARVHPMSGAGRVKDDASTDDTQYEFKNVLKTHSLVGKNMLALFRRSIRQGKEPVYVVYFEDSDLTAEITLRRGK